MVRIPSSLVACLACLFLAIASTGCNTTTPVAGPPAELPNYADLVGKYNAKHGGLDKLWTRAVVEVTWKDGDKDRFEQGEGNLIISQPSSTALSVGKLGNTVLWAGSNNDMSFLFDLKENDTTLYTIRNPNIGHPAAKPLPVSVKPTDLIKLLGIAPIDASKLPEDPAVEWVDGGYLIEPPGTGTRLVLSADGVPVRVDLLDDAGHSKVIAKLSNPESVDKLSGLFGGSVLNTHIEVTVPGKSDKFVIHLSDQSGGPDEARVTDDVFSLEKLTEGLKPSKTVELDKACPPLPAPAPADAPATAPAAPAETK